MQAMPGSTQHACLPVPRSQCAIAAKALWIPSGKEMLDLLRQSSLFIVTALAEIVGCYLPWLVLKQGKTAWLLLPAAFSLALFSWLLTLHPAAAGRTYAAYGGIYIAVA